MTHTVYTNYTEWHEAYGRVLAKRLPRVNEDDYDTCQIEKAKPRRFFDNGRAPAEAVQLVIDEAYIGYETFDESHYGDPSDGSIYD